MAAERPPAGPPIECAREPRHSSWRRPAGVAPHRRRPIRYRRRTIHAAILLALLYPYAWVPASPAQADVPVDVAARADGRVFLLRAAQPIGFELAAWHDPERLRLSLHGTSDIRGLGSFFADRAIDTRVVKSVEVRRTGPRDIELWIALAHPLAPRVYGVAAAGDGAYCLVVDLGAAEPHVQPFECRTAARAAKPSPTLSEDMYGVTVNGKDAGAAVVLKDADGQLWLRRSDVAAWRLREPAGVATMEHDGDSYDALASFAGVTAQLDPRTASLALGVAPGAFTATDVRIRQANSAMPTPSSYGAYLNYDFTASSGTGGVARGGLLDLHGFGPQGSVSSSMLWQSAPGMASHGIRLDTVFEKDDPAGMSTFRLGDGITGASDWAMATRFGGIQWATDFATRPDLLTMPLLNMQGQAALPSTVDLYLNQALLLHQNVPAGPFDLQDLPVITGTGELRMVVRDALGQEHTVVQPFYGDARLLRAGLQSYSYEAGFERLNYGLIGDDYGKPLLVGTHRYGFSDDFTGAMHGEWLPDRQTLGASGIWLLPALGTLSGSVALSHSGLGEGQLLALGLDHQGGRFNIGVRAQVMSPRFTQLGMQAGALAASAMISGYAALTLAAGSSLAFNLTRQNQRGAPDLDLVGMSYNQSFGRYGSLQSSLIYTPGQGDPIAQVMYTLPLGGRSVASMELQHQGSGNLALAQLQQSAPVGPGIGYRLMASTEEANRGEADLYANSDRASYEFDIAHAGTGDAYRASVSGSIALLGGALHLARQITDSFGVVQMPGFPGVRVYDENQLIGRTDNQGNAFVPTLRPYQVNHLSIEQADLPLDADVHGTSFTATPYAGSGLLLRVPVARVSNTAYLVTRAHGGPIPPGSEARIAGHAETYPVGFGGLVYLPTLGSGDALDIRWPDGSCIARPAAQANPDDKDATPRLECP